MRVNLGRTSFKNAGLGFGVACMFGAALLFHASSSFAIMPFAQLQPPDGMISKAKFIPAQQGLVELKMPLNMLAATPKIELVNASGKVIDHCSGSIISDDGTLLTAGHCVEECLARGQALTKIDGISSVDRAKLSSVSCSVRINGQIIPAQILATNDCRGADRNAASTVNIQCKGLDYAVLKIDERFVKEQPCFHVSEKTPAPGTGVAAIGFPPLTARQVYQPGARDADDDGPYLTPGETIAYQNFCRTVNSTLEFKDQKFITATKPAVQAGHVLQTTTDVLRGVSGAGLVNVNNSTLVGVARSTIHNNPNKECVGSGFYSSTASILAAIRTDFPNLSLAETFRCEKKAFAPQNETAPANTKPATVPPAQAPQISR